jgi:hypothetical protein
MKNRLRWLYGAMVVIALAPIWSVHYLPTQDGPSHLYNSWLLRELVYRDGGVVAQSFRIDWRPHPNWIASVVMALLMSVVPPLIAEKLLVTGIVVLFLTAVWTYSGEEGQPYAFFAFPFAYNVLFHLGFYNFLIGLGLYFLIVAVWWRRRDQPNARTIALVAALLVLCYFSHPLPLVLAVATISLLGVATRSSWRHLLAFVPVLPLMAWFALTQPGRPVTGHVSAELLWLTLTRALTAFSSNETTLGVALVVVLMVLIVATIASRPRGARNFFLIPTIAIVALYLGAPANMFGGSLIRERMALFVLLVPLAWVAPRWPRAATSSIVALLTVVSLAYTAHLVVRYRSRDRAIADFVRSARAIGPHTVVLPLIANRIAGDGVTELPQHAFDYVALEKNDVTLDNYEASAGYFPIANTSDAPPPDSYTIEVVPGLIDVAKYTWRAAYVFTWRVEANSPLWSQLQQHCVLVSDKPPGQVWRSRFEPPKGTVQTTLLPIAGSVGRRGAPGGVWWVVDQTVTNRGKDSIRVHVNGCAADVMRGCELDLAPGQSMPLSSRNSFLFITCDATAAGNLAFSTIAKRIAPDGTTSSIVLPAVPQRDFRRGRVEIDGVPFEEGQRINLRAWSSIPPNAPLTVRIVSRDGAALGQKAYSVDDNGYSVSPDLHADFPDIRGLVNVLIDADTRNVWGFVSATDPRRPMPGQYYPK